MTVRVTRAAAAAAALAAAVALAALSATLPSAPAQAAGVTAASAVPTIDAAGLKRVIAAKKNHVVVLNFWATWCGPCVEEFPSLITLQKKYRAKGVDVVTISFDDPQDLKTKVKPFLAKNGVSHDAFINKSGNDLDEGYLHFLEPKLPADAAVPLPRTYIFSRDGKLVKTLVGGQTQAAFEKAVAPYLK